MRPLIPFWFLSQQPLTHSINRFNLGSSSLSSELEDDFRNIELCPTTQTSYQLIIGQHDQKLKVSLPVLLSSDVGLSSNITVSNVTVTKHYQEEVRQFSFKPSAYLANFTSTVKYYGQKDNVVHLPNEPIIFKQAGEEYLIPNHSKGILAVESLSSGVCTLNSAAWGLFISCSINSPQLVISQLKELIRLAKAKGLLSDSTGQLLASTESFWGFNSLAADDLSEIVNIEDNALLGFAIVQAIHYLNDISYLDNSLGNFLRDSIELARGFAYCCAYSVSKVNGWCASSHEAGYYDFFSLSLKSTFLSSLFFNSFLLLEYDSFVHEQAARIFLAVSSSPGSLDDNYYSLFTEFNILEALSYKLWWLREFSPGSWSQEFQVYNNLRTELTDTDYLVASLRYLSPQPPQWVIDLVAINKSSCNLDQFTTLNISLLAPLACSKTQSLLIAGNVFETYAYGAQAYTAAVREELLRMLPEGSAWSSPDLEADRSSVIGGLLYAYSKTYFVGFLRYSLMSLPIFKSSGFLLRNLLRLLFPLASCLSESLGKAIITKLFLSPEVDVQAKLSFILRTEFDRTYLNPQTFSVFKSSEDYTYTPENNTFNHSYLEEYQSKAITYYPEEVEVVIPGLYNELTTSNQSLVLRPTPGFPHQTLGSSFVSSGNSYVEPLTQYLPLVRLKTRKPVPTGLTSVLGWAAPVGVQYLITGEHNYKQENLCSVRVNLGSFSIYFLAKTIRTSYVITESSVRILSEQGIPIIVE